MDEVHLAQVWLRWIAGDARAVLDRCTAVSIAFDTQALQQCNLRNGMLGECVRSVQVNCNDFSVHDQ